MRTVEEVTADVRAVYISLRQMFDYWHEGRHEQFMAACWNLYDLRKELAEITGSRDEAFELVRDVYHQVFSVRKEAERQRSLTTATPRESLLHWFAGEA
jgi:hypothetical protein